MTTLKKSNKILSKRILERLSDARFYSIKQLPLFFDELRRIDSIYQSMSDDRLSQELNETTLLGFYFESKIFISTKLSDDNFLLTLIHEVEHHHHRSDDYDETVSEILAYHMENLWKHPYLRVTRNYFSRLISYTVREPIQMSIDRVPLNRLI